ncbi:1,4-alpha-glucan branching protein GlgB, partial [Streptococcus hyovaginalis]
MDRDDHLYTFGIGENYHLHDFLGAHSGQYNGMEGYFFRVWAPNAENVHIIGDFTGWYDAPLQLYRHESGVWEGFTSDAK